MTHYIVHLYREMRLSFADIEADTAEAAAAIAREKATDEADDIEDCNGEDSAALVDVAGDEDYRHSVTIDFEGERIRKAAAKLLASLEAIFPYAENEVYSLEKLKDSPEAEAEADRAWNAVASAQAAIAEAKSSGIASADADYLAELAKQPSRFEIEHDPVENPDRAYVLVDGRFEVAIIRTGEGVAIDVYLKDEIDPIDSLTVWDEEVAAASAEAEISGEA
jgi:hypothetical protein